MSVKGKGSQNRKSKKRNLYTELDYEKLIDSMNENKMTIDDEAISFNNIDQILDARANCIFETKTITSGPIRELEIYPMFLKKDIAEEFRVKTTKKAQKNLNNKNAVKYFTRKLNANFKKGDYYLTLNYSNDNRPKSYEEAKKHVRSYIRKLNYEYMKLQEKLTIMHTKTKKSSNNTKINVKTKKKQYKKIKYMYVIEISQAGKGKYHVHMVLSSELSMDLVEECWKYGRRNNIRKIEPDEKHLTDLANYLSKDPKGKKRWGCSKGLKEPIITTSKKVSKKKIYEMDNNNSLIEKEMEKLNPGYKLIGFKAIRNKWTQMPYIHVTMRKVN